MRIIWLTSLSNSSLLANDRKGVQYRHSGLPFVLFESGATKTTKPLVDRSTLPLVLSQENKMEHQGKFSFINSRALGTSKCQVMAGSQISLPENPQLHSYVH